MVSTSEEAVAADPVTSSDARQVFSPEVDLGPVNYDPLQSDEQASGIDCKSNGDCLAVWGEANGAGLAGMTLGSGGQPDADFPLSIGNGADPAVAAGPTNFLVVWQKDGAVVGLRVSPAGERLDASPFQISDQSTDQSAPDVAFGGGQFLVAWNAAETAGSVVETYRVFGKRVAPDGTLQDPSDVDVTGTTRGKDPTVAHATSQFVVAWYGFGDSGSGDRVRASRIDYSGGVVDSPPIDVTEEGVFRELGLACLGTTCPVLWNDGDEAFVSTFDASDGTAGSRAGTSLGGATNGTKGGIASSSGRFYAVWDSQSGSTSEVRGRRVAPDLTPEGTGPVGLENSSSTQRRPSVAFDGSSFIAHWSVERDSLDVVGTTIDASSGSVGRPSKVFSRRLRGQRFRATAWNGDNYLALWEARKRTARENAAMFAYVSPSGQPLETPSNTRLTKFGLPTRPVGVLRDGDGWLIGQVVRGAESGFEARRYDKSMQWRSPDQTFIDTPLAADPESVPLGFFDIPSGYLFVWYEASDDALQTVRFSDDGSRVDAQPQTVVSDATQSATSLKGGKVVCQQDVCVAVWWRARASDPGNRLLAVRFESDGTRLDDSPVELHSSQQIPTALSVVPNPSGFLVVWAPEQQLAARRLASRPGGTGARSKVEFTDNSTDAGDPVAARIDGGYVVTWRGPNAASGASGPADIYGVRLTDDLAVVDGRPLAITERSSLRDRPAGFQLGPEGAAQFVWSRRPPHVTRAGRVYSRTIQLQFEEGESCEVDLDCLTGNCSGGTCETPTAGDAGVDGGPTSDADAAGMDGGPTGDADAGMETGMDVVDDTDDVEADVWDVASDAVADDTASMGSDTTAAEPSGDPTSEGPSETSGCSCGSGSSTTPAPAAWLLLLVVFVAARPGARR